MKNLILIGLLFLLGNHQLYASEDQGVDVAYDRNEHMQQKIESLEAQLKASRAN